MRTYLLEIRELGQTSATTEYKDVTNTSLSTIQPDTLEGDNASCVAAEQIITIRVLFTRIIGLGIGLVTTQLYCTLRL